MRLFRGKTPVLSTNDGGKSVSQCNGAGQTRSPPPEVKGGEPMETLMAAAQGVLAGLLTEALLALRVPYARPSLSS